MARGVGEVEEEQGGRDGCFVAGDVAAEDEGQLPAGGDGEGAGEGIYKDVDGAEADGLGGEAAEGVFYGWE